MLVIGARLVSYFDAGGGSFYNNVCGGGHIDPAIYPELEYRGMRAAA